MNNRRRSRFSSESSASFAPEDPEDQRQPALIAFSQIGMVLFIIALSFLTVWWALSDISGQYLGQNQQLGSVHLSIVRKATSLGGEIIYGNGAPLVMTQGQLKSGKQLELTFNLAEQWRKSGQTNRTVTFHGQINNGIITGVLEDSGNQFALELTRNALGSLYLQLQSHLPWIS